MDVGRRHLLHLGLGATAGGALAACGGGDPGPSTAPTSDPTPADRTPTDPAPAEGTPSGAGSSKVLVAYFSRPGENYYYGDRTWLEVGNTKVVARTIGRLIDCDLYEILATDPYPDEYDPTVARNRAEQEDDARPAIAGALPDLARYDVVLLGSPIWNVRAPMIMTTFIESVDLTGKTILPFVTYAVSGMSGVDQDYRRALPDAEVRDGIAIQGEEATEASSDLRAWLTSHGLR